uniref:Uncharacterized protein n=1 Tax=Phoenicopteridae CRESS-DNA-virus sp. TaxID=2815051 RepID=A0A8A4XCC4_9VIRU|nr:MAG: hypothetical protein [Phoenicopteridae CRESS-DNA-virus sp.]
MAKAFGSSKNLASSSNSDAALLVSANHDLIAHSVASELIVGPTFNLKGEIGTTRDNDRHERSHKRNRGELCLSIIDRTRVETRVPLVSHHGLSPTDVISLHLCKSVANNRLMLGVLKNSDEAATLFLSASILDSKFSRNKSILNLLRTVAKLRESIGPIVVLNINGVSTKRSTPPRGRVANVIVKSSPSRISKKIRISIGTKNDSIRGVSSRSRNVSGISVRTRRIGGKSRIIRVPRRCLVDYPTKIDARTVTNQKTRGTGGLRVLTRPRSIGTVLIGKHIVTRVKRRKRNTSNRGHMRIRSRHSGISLEQRSRHVSTNIRQILTAPLVTKHRRGIRCSVSNQTVRSAVRRSKHRPLLRQPKVDPHLIVRS